MDKKLVEKILNDNQTEEVKLKGFPDENSFQDMGSLPDIK